MKDMNITALRLVAAISFVALAPSCDEEAIEHPTETEVAAHQFPEQVATAYCASLFACGGSSACTDGVDLPYDTEADCVTHEQSQLEEVRTNAEAAGMIYDPTCAEQVIAAYQNLECLGYRQLSWEASDLLGPTGVACQPYYAEIPADGGTCIVTAGTRLNNCDPGQHCFDSLCSDVTDVSPCHDSCAEGTTCTDQAGAANGSGINGDCRPIVGIGESCNDEDFRYCEAGSYCPREWDDEGPLPAVCEAKLTVGEACDRDEACETYLCDQGQCATPSPVLCRQSPTALWRRAL